MKYSKSPTQFLRRVRGKNEGASKKLARALRSAAAMVDRKKREEFTLAEIKLLQGLRELITGRLLLNAHAKQIALLPADAPQTATITPDPEDL
jgi:hypothetical protein